MKASQLRDLSRKYAAGGISREDYLAERRRMIDAITRGEVELKYRELDPQGGSKPAPSRKPSRTLLAAGGLLLVLLIAFAAHFLSSSEPEPAASTPQTVEPPENPAVELLAGFEAADDWSNASLAAIETQWQSLPQADREKARESLPYRRIAREVQTRIREHEALVSAGGSPDALMRAARLRTFAERLGISD